MHTRKAFTMIETLIVLILIPLLLSLILGVMRLLTHYDYQLTSRQNFIAVIQLRKRVALGSQIRLDKNRLIMNYRNREVELICDEDKVIEVNGYLEYLTHLDRCEWKIDRKLIYLEYSMDLKTFRIFIGYA